MWFFGLHGSTAALATTLRLATTINYIGIGFQRGTHTRWQLVANDGMGIKQHLVGLQRILAAREIRISMDGKGPGATTSSSIASGGPSNTKRFNCGLTSACPKFGPGLAGI